VHHKNIHDDGITSASFVIDGAMDLQKLNLWLGMLLQARGDDIYRMKGILNIKHNKERFVFQVRMPAVCVLRHYLCSQTTAQNMMGCQDSRCSRMWGVAIPFLMDLCDSRLRANL
jgi:G3E family GTPase